MKTTKQWLMTLPKGLREDAINRILYVSKYWKHPNLSSAILLGISWGNTLEEYHFWDAFWYNLKWAEGGE